MTLEDCKNLEEFFKVMLKFFPSRNDEYRKIIENYDEVLETVIIEDIFMPEVIKLLSENKNIKLLKSIFDYFEKDLVVKMSIWLISFQLLC